MKKINLFTALLKSSLLLPVLVLLSVSTMSSQTFANTGGAFIHQSGVIINTDTIHVAAPTGETETDRASILAALERTRPGDVVQFAAGLYLVGEVVRISTPRLTLLGHPGGTVLRGCEADEYEANEREFVERDGRPSAEITARCGVFELSGGHVTVRGLTLEQTRMGLMLGCCHLEPRPAVTPGGYVIEGNTFRNSLNGVRPWTTEPSVIRGNRFINTFHAISGVGSHLHVLANDISVPDPSQVPGTGHPSFAIAVGPLPHPAAEALGLEDNGEGIVIAGNRIEGHPDGIFVRVYPGTSFRGSEIRDNTIAVARVPIPSEGARPYIVDMTAEADSSIVGIPIALYARPGFAGPGDAELENGRFEENRIEGNRLIGAEGVALALQRGRRNRIADNVIRDVARREPFPGNTLVSSSELWLEANGSAIWISPGSDGNEIAGNTFEDIAAYEVYLQGDSNRVELRDANDDVRDLGNGNSITSAGRYQSQKVIAPDTTDVLVAAEAFLTAFNNLNWEQFYNSFHPSVTVFQPFGSPLRNNGRDEVASFFQTFFELIRSNEEGPPYLNIVPEDLRIQMLGDAAIVTFHLKGDESVGRRTLVFSHGYPKGPWKIVHLHASQQQIPGPEKNSVNAENDEDLKTVILTLTQNLATAWTSLNPDDYLSYFSDDLIFYFQGKTYSRPDFEKIVRETLSELQESTLEVDNPEVKVLGPDAAIITFQLEERMLEKKGNTTTINGMLTLVYERRDNQWLVVRAHESLSGANEKH